MEQNPRGYAWIIWSCNHPNIISNQLDQAAKNTENRYQARIDAIAQDIEKAFSSFNTLINGDNTVIKRILEHKKDLPLEKLKALKEGETLCIELKREQLPEKDNNSNPPTIKIPQYQQADIKFSKKTEPKIAFGEQCLCLLAKKESIDTKFPKNENFQIDAIAFSIPLKYGNIDKRVLEGWAFEKAVERLQFCE